VQFFSPLEGNTAHVRIYKQIEAKINKYKTNHCWYILSQNATAKRWSTTPRCRQAEYYPAARDREALEDENAKTTL
jgi:hypothetical protein